MQHLLALSRYIFELWKETGWPLPHASVVSVRLLLAQTWTGRLRIRIFLKMLQFNKSGGFNEFLKNVTLHSKVFDKYILVIWAVFISFGAHYYMFKHHIFEHFIKCPEMPPALFNQTHPLLAVTGITLRWFNTSPLNITSRFWIPQLHPETS